MGLLEWRQATWVCLQHCGEVISPRNSSPFCMFLSTSERPFFWERGTYAVEVVAGVLAVEVAGAVLDVAIEHGGLLGARDKGEHCLCVVRWGSPKYEEFGLGSPRGGGGF